MRLKVIPSFAVVPFLFILRDSVGAPSLDSASLNSKPKRVSSGFEDVSSDDALPFYVLCHGVGCVDSPTRNLKNEDEAHAAMPKKTTPVHHIKAIKHTKAKPVAKKDEVHSTIKKPQKNEGHKKAGKLHLKIVAVNPTEAVKTEDGEVADTDYSVTKAAVAEVIESSANRDDEPTEADKAVHLTINVEPESETPTADADEEGGPSKLSSVAIVCGVSTGLFLAGGLFMKLCGVCARTTKPIKYKDMKNDDGFFSPDGESCEDDDGRDMYFPSGASCTRQHDKAAFPGMFDLELEEDDEGPYGHSKKDGLDDSDFREVFKIGVT